MEIKELISKVYRGEEVTKEELWEVFSYLRHIPNIKKTDEEFELYCRMMEEKGKPLPKRNTICRPLEEEYFKNKGIKIEQD